MSATTLSLTNNPTAILTVDILDKEGNFVTGATPGTFAVTLSGGTIGAFTCVQGVCTATYTAPAGVGPQTIHVLLNGVDILNSPILLTIVP
jgi:hypothetical protein